MILKTDRKKGLVSQKKASKESKYLTLPMTTWQTKVDTADTDSDTMDVALIITRYTNLVN